MIQEVDSKLIFNLAILHFLWSSVIFTLLETRVVERDPSWRSGGTTLQGHSTQQFMTAEPIKVDQSKKVEIALRLVAR